MKLFSNAIISLPISGCKDCPNRISQAVRVPQGFRSVPCCKLIFTTWNNPQKNLQHRTYASVVEPVVNGGTLPECPLPDHVTTYQGENHEFITT